MKKLYAFLFAAAAAVSANAGNMQFTVHGNPVQDGDRIDITNYLEPFGVGYQYNPELVLTSSTSGEATVVVDFYKNNTPAMDSDWMYGANMAVSVCSFGNCTMVNPGKTTEKKGNLTAGQAEPMQVELTVELGDEQKLEDLTVDSEFSFECKLGGETVKLIFFAQSGAGNVNGINSDSNAPAVYYDLQGRRIDNPSKGIYILRQGRTVRKVII